jgi:hypothetical protein
VHRVLPFLFLLACGPETRPAADEPTAEALRLEGWPPLPQVQSTAVVRMLAIAEALPPLPAADGVPWVEQVFVPWMEQRQRALSQAAELRRQVRSGSSSEQAVAVALHGAILQATHDALIGAHAERIDPAAAEALAGPAEALADKARGAYEICHQLAIDAGPALDGWRHGCDDHLARLPD